MLGLAHGLGFVALALLIWYAAIRHEAPYTLLAATLTPVGPVGSVIAIHYIERKYPEASGDAGAKKVGRDREGGHATRPTLKAPLDLTPYRAIVPGPGRGNQTTAVDRRALTGRSTWRGGTVGGRGSTRPTPPPARR